MEAQRIGGKEADALPPMSRKTKAYLITAAAAALLTNPLSWLTGGVVRGGASLLFGILTLVWMETMRTRLSGKSMRRCILAGAFLLFTLFPLRQCRYTIFAGNPAAERFFWYAYYIPTLTVPMLFFFAALCVDRQEEDRPLRYAHALWIVPVVLVALFLTNDWHGLAFEFDPSAGEEVLVRHGPVYWIGAVWIALLDLAAFSVLLLRCRRSASRRLWFVPFLAAVPPVLLILLYGIRGGSPEIGAHTLYQYQEAYVLLYVCVWEACIQIGLIPSSADYDRIFPLSSVNAAIADMDGRVVYASERAPDLTQALIHAAAEKPVPVGANRWLRCRFIPGGSVLWCEDLSDMIRLNRELEQVNESLSERNAVLAAENDIRQARASFEAMNRLWDGIVGQIRPQLRTIGAKLGTEDRTPSDEDLADCAFLGAYVKRRSNLSLLAEGADALSTEELGLAVRESLAYLSLRGILCDVREDGETKLEADAVLSAYDAFEDAAERAVFDGGEGMGGALGSLLVTLTADGPDFSMTMLFDTKPPALSDAALKACARTGLTAERWEEDGVGRLRLRKTERGIRKEGDA